MTYATNPIPGAPRDLISQKEKLASLIRLVESAYKDASSEEVFFIWYNPREGVRVCIYLGYKS